LDISLKDTTTTSFTKLNFLALLMQIIQLPNFLKVFCVCASQALIRKNELKTAENKHDFFSQIEDGLLTHFEDFSLPQVAQCGQPT
jgi:hypothetical protein